MSLPVEPPKKPYRLKRVLAIDFETANTEPASACAIGVAALQDGDVVTTRSAMFQPYTGRAFTFSRIHGIRWKDVEGLPNLHEIWPQFEELWNGADAIIAHNAPFDVRVLFACARSGHFIPRPKWIGCTVDLSRRRWPQWPNHRLDTACSMLNIPLAHHKAESDAIACASIFAAAMEIGSSAQLYTFRDWSPEAIPGAADDGRTFHRYRTP